MHVNNIYAAEICDCHCYADRSHSLADIELQSNEACKREAKSSFIGTKRVTLKTNDFCPFKLWLAGLRWSKAISF